MPVNMPTHAHGQGYTDLNFLIPELAADLHYKKGPYYADEGDFATAGTVRIGLARCAAGTATLGVGEDGYRRALLMGSSGSAAARCWPPARSITTMARSIAPDDYDVSTAYCAITPASDRTTLR